MPVLNFRWPAWLYVYIDDFSVVSGDGCDLAFLCDDIEGKGEGAMHLFEEVGVVAEVGPLEKILDLRGRGGT